MMDADPVFTSEPTFAGAHSPDAEIERGARKIRERVMAEIDRLNLRQYIADLEIDGWTVLPPEVVGVGSAFVEALREQTLAAIDKVGGGKGPVVPGMTELDIRPDRINLDAGAFGQAKANPYLLQEGPIIFEQALMNKAALAVISYLLGESCRVRHVTGVKKGPGRDYMPMHTDNNHEAQAAVFPSLPEFAVATWILTDYDEENGSTCFVDGSHKLCRPPTSYEARDLTLFKPMTAKAGSIMVHNSNVWHGSVPRRAPGYRVNIIQGFGRWYGMQQQHFPTLLPPEAFERNSERFSSLTGKTPRDGYGSGGNRMMILSPFG